MASQDTVPAATRMSAAWDRKWLVLAVAIVTGIVVAAVIESSPSRYSATASVSVTVAQTRAGQHEAALGSNELAAQYALLAASDPVRSAAEKALGDKADLGPVSAQPVAGYNLINITDTSDSAAKAGSQASAVATALVDYLNKVNSEQSLAATAAANASVKALDSQIKTLQNEIKILQTDPTSQLAQNLGSLQNSLSSLVGSRQNIISSTTEDITGGTPDIRTVDLPTTGRIVSKHVTEYAAIAAIVGLLVGIELSYQFASVTARRRPNEDGTQLGPPEVDLQNLNGSGRSERPATRV